MSENMEVENAVSHETEIVHSVNTVKSPQTTIPFVKNNNFNYEWLMKLDRQSLHCRHSRLARVCACRNHSGGSGQQRANLTDGLDGLCAGTSAIIGVALAIMAYLGGNVIYSGYLNIMYIPGSEELVVYAAAFIGALVGFLWYNAFPAQVFMGDTGSLTLGVSSPSSPSLSARSCLSRCCALYSS